MSYIEIIRKNVAKAIVIRKNAKRENVNYYTAMVMYHDGKNDIDKEMAEAIVHELKLYNISINMIDKLDLMDFIESYQNYGYIDGLKVIAKYGNPDIIGLYEEAYSDYGLAIYHLMSRGIPMDVAIKLFDIKVSYEMRKSKLSREAAWAKVLKGVENITARIYEHEFKSRDVSRCEFSDIIKTGILNFCKTKEVNGIMLASQTDAGLQRLEKLVTVAFEKSNQQYRDTLSMESVKNILILGDFSLIKADSNYYDSRYNYIYIDIDDEKKSLEKFLDSYYHETTHFLDDVRGTNFYYSVDNPDVRELFEKIKSMSNAIMRGISLSNFKNVNAIRYINNPVLNQRWIDEIRNKYPDTSDSDLKLYLKQKKLYKMKMFKSLSVSLTDIYDGMENGKLYEFGITEGHGMKYYSNPDNVLKEFLAQIGSIYNGGESDILIYEFGEELANEIISLYENFISNVKAEDPSPSGRKNN